MDAEISSRINAAFLHVCAHHKQTAPLAILAREVLVIIPSLLNLLRQDTMEQYKFNVGKYIFDNWIKVEHSDLRKSHVSYRAIVSTIIRIFIHDYLYDYYISVKSADIHLLLDDMNQWFDVINYEIKHHGISATLYTRIQRMSPNTIFHILQRLSPNDLLVNGIEYLASSLYCEMDDNMRKPWLLLKKSNSDCLFFKSYLLAHYSFYSSSNSLHDILYTHGSPPEVVIAQFTQVKIESSDKNGKHNNEVITC